MQLVTRKQASSKHVPHLPLLLLFTVLLVSLTALFGIFPGTALAATITVDTTADVVDPDDGVTSLREAIAQANLDPDYDLITFDLVTPATITIDQIDQVITQQGVLNVAVWLPDIVTDMDIVGPGADLLTIRGTWDAPSGTWLFRVDTPVSADNPVTAHFSGLTLTGGDHEEGSAVWVRGGAVSVSDCTITGNSAYYAVLCVEDMADHDGTLSVSDCAVHDNEAPAVCATGGATAAVRDCEVLNNHEGWGGGVMGLGGDCTVTDCLFQGNSADNVGGGAVTWGGGNLVATGCTFCGNSGTLGGAVVVFQNNEDKPSTASLTNCTFTNNSAFQGGGITVASDGLFGMGGHPDATATLTNCTIAGNSVAYWYDGEGTRQGGMGGGIYGGNPGSATLCNTIVCGNSAPEGDQIYGTVDTAASFSNLIDYGTDGSGLGGLVNGVNGNMVVTDALLAPLDDYGGPTQTMALLPGSPALDAASATYAPSTDQRGVARGASPDIGAFESQGFTLTITGGDHQTAVRGTVFAAPLQVTVTDEFGEPVAGGLVTFTPPVTGASAVITGSPATVAANGRASVTATANDTLGGYTVTAATTGASSVGFTLANINVAPTVEAGANQSTDEGTTIYLDPAAFTDPGTADTHTATITWGDGTAVESGTVSETLGSGTVSGAHTYADNGTYTVTVAVTDNNGGTGSDTFTITVRNVSPRVSIDTENATTLNRGPFFLSRVGVGLGLAVSVYDPGSDDLTVFVPGGTYPTQYNNGLSPDPYPSPGGTHPVTLSLTVGFRSDLPGVYSQQVSCRDDDGGVGSSSVVVAVRGAETQPGDVAAWLSRFSSLSAAGSAGGSLGAQTADETALLDGYLSVVRYVSDYLGGGVYTHRTQKLQGAADAAALLAACESGDTEAELTALLLAAWLNYACGARSWGELLDIDGDGHTDLAYCLVLYRAEQVLCRDDASAAELEEALARLRCCFASDEGDQPQEPEEPAFSDVSLTHPYYAAIEAMAARGIITGFADGSFKPDEPVSRQQFAKMIVRSLGLDVTGQEPCPFGDVAASLDAGDLLYPRAYVAVCAAEGITKGRTATSFAPYADITRQQLLSMVARAAGLQAAPESFTPAFTALQFSLREHYENARDAAYAGLLDHLVGLGGSYDFLLPATRGECAQLLWNLVQQGEG